MVLAFLGGHPAFGRISVFDAAIALYGNDFRFRPKLYRRLLSWKMWHVRGCPPEGEPPDKAEALEMCKHLLELNAFAMAEATNV